MMRPTLRTGLTLLACLALQPQAQAVNGAQPGGNGAKNAAMGGASIALPLDAMAQVNNPAGLSWVADSVVIGGQVFHGESSAEYILPGNRLSNRQTILSPEFALSHTMAPTLRLGLAVSGGGAGSDYGQAALPVPGAGTARTDLKVAELATTLAWAPRDDLSLGVALRLVRQRFEADGVIVPAPVPGGLLPLSSHGRQSATGAGLRFGATWRPDARWTVGADVKPRTRMSKLSGYADDLLAYSEGRLDVPGQYGIGVAWQATDRLLVGVDWLRILWGDIKANQDPNGFGWRSQPVFRLGAAWQLDGPVVVRAGYSRNRSQISSDRAVQNLLVPAIHDRAWTVGLGWTISPTTSIDVGYELNPRTTLTGTEASAGTTLTSKVQLLMFSVTQRF